MKMVPTFLTTAYPLDKHYFFITGLALKVLGFHPESKQTLPIQLWGLFNISFIMIVMFLQFLYAYDFLATDTLIALDAFTPALSGVMSWWKLCCIWWYRVEIKNLLERVRKLNEEQNSPEKIRIKERYYTLATQLIFVVLMGTFCTASSYCTRPTVVNINRYFHGQPVQAEMPYKVALPEFLLRRPIFYVTIAVCNWYGYVTAFGLTSGDGLFLSFCFYISTLLKALSLDLRDILKDLSVHPKLRRLTEKEVCFELMKIIKRHNEIADLTKQFSKIVVWLTLGHFVTSSIIIGSSTIAAMMFSGYGIVVYVVYTIAVLAEVFLYCLGGEAIMGSSTGLGDTAYNSYWYTHSSKIQKMVLLIIIRSQRALIVKVPFFTPSMSVLTSILRFTGSLIALANELL